MNEDKELASIPKSESDDVKKSIIRTTIKNEELLNKKIENLKIKKINKKKTNNLKHRFERSGKVEGVLGKKIEQSIERARYVQNSRKSGWDQINKGIELTNNLVHRDEQPEKTKEEVEKEEEDSYVEKFFNNDSTEQDDMSVKKEDQDNYVKNGNKNRFSILEESEA